MSEKFTTQDADHIICHARGGWRNANRITPEYLSRLRAWLALWDMEVEILQTVRDQGEIESRLRDAFTSSVFGSE